MPLRVTLMSLAKWRHRGVIGLAAVAAVGLALLAGTGCSDDAASQAAQTSGAVGGGGSGAGGDGGSGGGGAAAPTVILPKASLGVNEIGVLVNDLDPQSVEVAAYYQQARGIPAEHVYHLSFPAAGNVLSAADFAPLIAKLDAEVAPEVQAYAITWTTPYRVGCMAVTAAFSLGFDDKYCNTTGMACGPTAPIDYFDSDSTTPWTDHGVRPSMAIAAETVGDAKLLIDRGVAADGSFPSGDGYLVRTTDSARSVRWQVFAATQASWDYPEGLKLSYIDNADGSGSNVIENQQDVLFYFTGLANVPAIDSNSYRPGAIADHLTSYGGQVPQSSQMSIVRWLEAGATASYGTVVEPCNYTTKFPDTSVLLPHYYRGETVIEAYWKSVQWPGEGMFVGEPLARPWGTQAIDWDGDTLVIRTTQLKPGVNYELVGGASVDGPFEVALADIAVMQHQLATIELTGATAAVYQLRAAGM